MPQKDYYQTLNISPSASAEEIKKAFRKLALQYHPDKNTNTASATKRFVEIQEAYLVLKDKTKRAAYNYERFKLNPQHTYKPLAKTAEDILALSAGLRKKIALQDPFRLDRDLLSFEIKDLLSAHNMQVLLEMNDAVMNKNILLHVLACMRPLPFHTVVDMAGLLKQLAGIDPAAGIELDNFLQNVRWQQYGSRYKIYIALAVAVLFCLILFLSGKK